MSKQSRRSFLSSLGGGAALLGSWKRSAAGAAGQVDVYRVEGFTGLTASGRHDGVDALVELIGRHGLYFYKSRRSSAISSPNGLIGPRDVVMIKVNSQWDRRGMTNVDLVQGVIKSILSHPDGFEGEVVIVENVQFRRSDFPRPGGNAFNWQRTTNAQERTRTFEQVASELSAEGKVSCFDWTNLRMLTTWPEGDHETNAYHRPDRNIAIAACYPRFTTEYGTRINFHDGIWTGENYDQDHLKLINIPVLKDHFIYSVTACVKNYMGVVINYYHDTFVRDCGIMMTTTRVPDLNILDCTYVGVSGGPGVGDAGSTRQDILVAGTDPVAVDYYASKNILYALTNRSKHNPDPSTVRRNTVQRYLENARAALQEAGYRTVPGLSDDAVRLITPETKVSGWKYHSA